MSTLASSQLRTARTMRKNKEYHVGWEGHEGMRVRAASFLGAMRAAFGPGEYYEVEQLEAHVRRFKWLNGFFVVTLQLD